MKSNKHFLSHRFRGFDELEHSKPALDKALKSNIPYLELDTRVSKDGIFYVIHDDKVRGDNETLYITQSTQSEIDTFQQRNNIEIMTLEYTLGEFKSRVNQEQKLFIDIKDYGFEKNYYDLIVKYDLLLSAVFVSWIPQVLFALHEIDPSTKKILSYTPIPKLLSLLSYAMKFLKVPLLPIVLIGKRFFKSDLKNLSLGYQHAYLTDNLNDEIVEILKDGGGVCILKNQLNRRRIAYHHNLGLKVAAFSAYNRAEYERLVMMDIDIVFCDFIDEFC
jgi:glycerophosphoryl diester phosphodiesterase